ncbi:unnamed protein product [Rotaria sordida]|uniref:Uncharacterized protein n=1 Tax=Rotaria sordida TaxID=392033 RepID=A0A814EQ22_9BILA|nr:unnamed protein product [Rotaria sordida]CAF0972472.1 unnamed protein product [Rotaria sordida]
MDPLQSEQVGQHLPTVIEYQPSISINNNDLVTKNDNNDDHQAQIRRRAPTRHSIKSLPGRKILSRQTSVNESKRKSNKNPPTPISTSNETKHFHYVPSVSQIAPLPQNKSHGILPVLSLDGRDAPILMQSETSETDLTSNTTTSNNENARQPHRICLDPTTRRQYSYSQSSVLSEGILVYGVYLILEPIQMDKNVLSKPVPGIYSTSLVDVNHSNVTTMYHPLKQQINPHELTVDSLTPYNSRSRANSNIIERRFSNVEQPIQIFEPHE